MPESISTAYILWSLLFGSIGMGYFIYGKRQSDVLVRYTGVGLMVYPMFVYDSRLLVAVGVALLALPKLVRR